MSRRTSDSNAAKATPDVFVGLLFVSVASLITGIFLGALLLFKRTDKYFADVI